MKLFVDSLTVIDCSYLHPEYGVEGESWICDAVLDGALDSQSMVMDFGHVKKRLKRAIDALADHCLIVPVRAAHLESINYFEDSVELRWRNVDKSIIRHTSPRSAVCLLDSQMVNEDSLAAFLQQAVMQDVNETVRAVSIRLRPEKIDGPYYHYSHGLKKHDGNCQRIAHGHRSAIEIFRNGQLDAQLMSNWADRWKHIYIGSQEDIIAQVAQDGVLYYQFSYVADQGQFELSLPASRCYMMDSDSTVECIAQHLLTCLKTEHPQDHFVVKAYEGVQKGAIAEG